MNIIANILHRHLAKDIVDTIMYNIWREEHRSKFSKMLYNKQFKDFIYECYCRTCDIQDGCCKNNTHTSRSIIHFDEHSMVNFNNYNLFSYQYQYNNNSHIIEHAMGIITPCNSVKQKIRIQKYQDFI
jgi:hypothetical protein